MSDQSARPTDQRSPPTAQEQPWFYQNRDRRKGWNDRLLIALLVLATGCVKIPPVEKPPAPLERWVDEAAAPEGDGGVMAALKGFPPRVSGVLHVRSGLYRGPFSLDDGAVIVGHGEVVLYLEGEGVVVTSRGRTRLEHVSLQGGAVGLTIADGHAALAQVQLSSHRRVGIEVGDAGLSATELQVQGRSGEAVGVEAINADVRLERATFLGALTHGVRAADSRVSIDRLRSEGPATALQVMRGSLEAHEVKAAGGQRAAISLVDTQATVRGVETSGHEYGVLGTKGSITVTEVLARAPLIAGLAFFKGSVTLDQVRVHRAGSGGGLQLLDVTSSVGAVTISDAQGTGVLLRQGTATIKGLEVHLVHGDLTPSGTLLSGDALQVRDATVTLERLEVSEVDGAALAATNFSSVNAKAITVDGAGTAGVVAERRSRVVVEALEARSVRGAAIAVFEEGVLEVGRLTTSAVETPAWADCLGGAQVRIGAANSKQDWQPCVRAPR